MKKQENLTMDVMVVAIGLVIILGISSWVIAANNESYKQSLDLVEVSNILMLQQRDAYIAKLMKQVRASQAAVASAKKEAGDAKAQLETATEKIEAIKTVVQ